MTKGPREEGGASRSPKACFFSYFEEHSLKHKILFVSYHNLKKYHVSIFLWITSKTSATGST